MQIPLFCLGYHLSKHKITMCFEYFGGHGFPKLTPRLPFTILNGAAGKEVFQYI